MLQFLPNLERLCADIAVWGLTSHLNLVLLARDDYTSVWWVRIVPRTFDQLGYDVSYSDPPEGDEYSNTTVAPRFAAEPDEATKLVAAAIAKSGAWPDRFVAG